MESTNVILQKPKHFLLLMLFLQLIFDVIVLVDLSFARQVIGFFYVTFIPGFLALKLLRMDKINILEIVQFSVGLSIAIVMLVGLVLNIFCPMFNILEPLSTIPVLIALNMLVLILAVVIYPRSEPVGLLGGGVPKKFLGLVLLSVFPLILSIVGVMFVNLSGNNFILLLMILGISLFVIAGLALGEKFPGKLYAFMVFVIALSLLYHSSLISNYIVGFGSDSHVEHFVFQSTKNCAYWNLTNPFKGDLGLGRMHSMLSITILPTIYSFVLNIDSTWVFKVIYPLIFSLVPLGLFQIWKAYIGKRLAFASAFLFMAQETFCTEMLGLNRQMIAELFFVLLMLVILNKTIKPINRTLCFIIFSFALVVSHYGLAEIFLFFISIVLISLIILRRPSKNLTVGMVVLFFAIMFTWYVYTSNASVFSSILEFGDYVYRQLSDFFNPASRGETILQGLGLEPPPTMWNAISRGFAYFIEALIAIGFVGLITKRVKSNFDREYYAFTLIATCFLGALIAVPGLAETLNMTRFYHVLLFFLAPLCTLGAEVVATITFKRKKHVWTWLLLLVLIPYFLFQTSFVYEIVGSASWSLSLSGYRMGVRKHFKFGVVTEQEVLGANWLSQHNNEKHPTIYAGFLTPLVGYGDMDPNKMFRLTNLTKPNTGEFVYLGKVNTWYGVIVDNDVWNTSDIYTSNLWFSSCIYSSGECEIYKTP
jgi:uncharacterized membrane protein